MPLPFFQPKKERSLGVDIGTSSIKIVELVKKGEGIELTNYAEYRGNVDVAFHSSSVRLLSSEISDIIKGLLREARINSRDATISVPVFSGFSTVISLPQMPEAELAQAVEYEAKKYIPLPISEVQFEWMRLESRRGNTQNNAEGIKVFIVAVTNELINRYHEIAKLSGLNLKYLEIETFSLARVLSDSAFNLGKLATRPNPFLIIDIGSRSTILSVADSGWPVFTRSIDISGFELSKTISSSLGVDFDRAEELKRAEGVAVGDGLLVPLIDSILLEARRTAEAYAQSRKRTISRVILSGGSAQMPGLLEHVVKSFGRETVIANPFHGIIYQKELEPFLLELGPSFCVAMGLALREFR